MDFRILYDLSDLRDTGFGQPPPRHGLNLLWWFAHNCVRFDSNGRIIAKCNPANGDFGFDQFNNWDRLLPYTVLKYYKVGNLKRSDSLPNYVTKNYTGQSDKRNTDRIIVSFDSSLNKFEKIYVTQHLNQKNFDQNRTYRISIGLIKKIRELRHKDFLRETTKDVSKDKHQALQTNSCQSASNEPIQDNQELSCEDSLRGHTNCPEQLSLNMPQSVQNNQPQPSTCQSKRCCCALICCGLLIPSIIAATVYFLFFYS